MKNGNVYTKTFTQLVSQGSKRAQRNIRRDGKTIKFHQKSLMHLINGELTRHSSRQQRWQSYWVEGKKAVQLNPKDWITSVLNVCHPISFGWLNISLSIGWVSLTNELLEQLARVSVSTVQRWLAWCSREIDRQIVRPPLTRM